MLLQTRRKIKPKKIKHSSSQHKTMVMLKSRMLSIVMQKARSSRQFKTMVMLSMVMQKARSSRQFQTMVMLSMVMQKAHSSRQFKTMVMLSMVMHKARSSRQFKTMVMLKSRMFSMLTRTDTRIRRCHLPQRRKSRQIKVRMM